MIFFLNSSVTGIAACSKATGFYCPATAQNLSTTTQGLNGASGTIDFSVANAESLFANGTDSAFNDLAGPGNDFDWRLPFFSERTVFTAIEGKDTPDGVSPYWAF